MKHTYMDYEKKYNEALNDMRVIYPNLKGDAKLAVEHAFPELAESEDERIRKAIMSRFQERIRLSEEEFPVYTQEEVAEDRLFVAWLEKQKESLHILGKCKENPDSFTDEDERIRKWIVEELEITRDAMSGKNDYSDDPDIVARLKRLDEAIAWLEEQKEQKPVEWSEEDKKMLDDIIRSLPRMAMGNIEMLPSVAEQYANRLKSLRPSWKPSEDEEPEYYQHFDPDC